MRTRQGKNDGDAGYKAGPYLQCLSIGQELGTHPVLSFLPDVGDPEKALPSVFTETVFCPQHAQPNPGPAHRRIFWGGRYCLVYVRVSLWPALSEVPYGRMRSKTHDFS